MTKIASVISFFGIISLTYICAAEPDLSSTAQITKVESPLAPAANVSANVSGGRWLIGGSAGYFDYGQNQTSVWLMPTAKYFLVNRLALGLGTALHWSDGKMVSRGFTPSLSYYYLVGKSYAAFFEQNMSYSWINSSDLPDDSYVSRNVRSSLGIDWFLNPNVAVTTSLGVTYGMGSRIYPGGFLSFSIFL